MPRQVVGLVDVETSHPGSWIPIIKELGYAVAVYDSGRRYSAAQIEEFALRHGVERVFHDLAEMAEEVDLGLIATANWDLHLAQSAPFIARGKPVLIDKPLVGCWDDVAQLLGLAQAGAVVGGGSSLRYSTAAAALKEKLQAAGETILSVYTVCSGMGYYYAVHLVSLLQALIGPGIARVRALEVSPLRVEFSWGTGQAGAIEVVPPSRGAVPFAALVVTDMGTHHLQIDDVTALYRDFLGTVIPALVEGRPPVPLVELLEVERALLAALVSREQGGTWVEVSGLDGRGGRLPVYDGTQFFAGYLGR